MDAAQVLLGHASPSSVEVYVHPSEERQRDAVRKMAARFDGAPHSRERSVSTAAAALREAPLFVVRACGASCCVTRWIEEVLVELGWDAEALVVRRVVEHPSFGFPGCEVEGCEGR